MTSDEMAEAIESGDPVAYALAWLAGLADQNCRWVLERLSSAEILNAAGGDLDLIAAALPIAHGEMIGVIHGPQPVDIDHVVLVVARARRPDEVGVQLVIRMLLEWTGVGWLIADADERPLEECFG